MDQQEEYERLRDEERATQDSLDDAYNEYGSTQDKINRLKSVRRTLYECCDSFKDVKKNVKRLVRDDYKWTGENYNLFSSYSSSLRGANDDYYRNLDEARDSINDEITRLENEMYRQEGLIGHLRALLNSLANKIQNVSNTLFD